MKVLALVFFVSTIVFLGAWIDSIRYSNWAMSSRDEMRKDCLKFIDLSSRQEKLIDEQKKLIETLHAENRSLIRSVLNGSAIEPLQAEHREAAPALGLTNTGKKKPKRAGADRPARESILDGDTHE